MIGAINDEILNTDELALELIKMLRRDYPKILEERYHLTNVEKELDILLEIAKNRNCIGKGNELDYSKAAKLLIEEFRSGAIGNITLEKA